MISITPIKNLNCFQNKQETINRPCYMAALKSDTFERSEKKISFGGKSPLSVPVDQIEDMLNKTLKLLKEEPDLNKKIQITYDYTDKFTDLFEGINSNFSLKKTDTERKFCADRTHEVLAPINEFYSQVISDIQLNPKDNLPIQYKPEDYDNIFEYVKKRTLGSLERFELILSKGLENDSMNPREVFGLAKESIQDKAAQKNVQIVSEGEEILGEYAEGIQALDGKIHNYELYTIFSNLIQNAVKYTSKDSTVFTKIQKQKISDKDFLVFSIKDKGIGIPKEEYETVLNGKRASNALASGIDGTGYGLKRVKKILDMVNSQVTENLDEYFIKIKSPVDESDKNFPGTEISAYINLES